MDAVLAGKVLIRCDVRVPKYATVDLSGLIVENVASRGKHLLIRIGDPENGSIIHSHLKMEGTWHVYGRGERWRRPTHKARCVLEVDSAVVVGFELGILEVLSRRNEDDAVGYLGPDVLGPGWDEAEALRRLRSHPEEPVGVALLDQRNLAGLGNIYRCEVCFLARVNPFTPMADVPNLERIVTLSKALLEANKDRSNRSTTGTAVGRHGDRFWVYGRNRCLRCRTAVVKDMLGANELALRDVYYCPNCQPLV
nr:DNA-formamidopyrimidine glycosylase family protein [Arthrobacter roseus]